MDEDGSEFTGVGADGEWSEGWYDLLKTLVEDIAWNFAKENNIDLLTINPTLVSGPLLQPELNTSAVVVLNFVNGSSTFKNITLGWIDVRDVENAHILAYENASANGRYILVERVIHHQRSVSQEPWFTVATIPTRRKGLGEVSNCGEKQRGSISGLVLYN
ncbi:phenylacetaldehyde reductase-like [Vigna umbellata]|uniref:phenylacetaldehyde reductase-like n=1 Tax=Vigna umbellata TaxID=87088 RepID=UPI001F5EA438|nr:phenylacetaldehyde reductase-like [Vigna umbellata]